MPTIRLTQAAWLAQAVAAAKGVLTVHLTRTGIDQDELRQKLHDYGVGRDWNGGDLVAIRDALVADGTIEIEA